MSPRAAVRAGADPPGWPLQPITTDFTAAQESLAVRLGEIAVPADDGGLDTLWVADLDASPFEGRHYRLEQAIGAPAALTRPRPPILIGGKGARRTLRLVARYADACNLFDIPDGGKTIRRKLDVLRGTSTATPPASRRRSAAVWLGNTGSHG